MYKRYFIAVFFIAVNVYPARAFFCTSNSDCKASEWCWKEPAINKCLPDRPGNYTCTRSAQCLSNLCLSSRGDCACLKDSQCYDSFSKYLWCNLSTRACYYQYYGGEACEASNQCRSQSCISGKCNCLKDQHCSPFSFCLANTQACVKRFYIGEACERNAQCISNLCSNKVCACTADGECGPTKWCELRDDKPGYRTCKDDRYGGGHCLRKQMCKSNFCCSGTTVCPKVPGYTLTNKCGCTLNEHCQAGYFCESRQDDPLYHFCKEDVILF